MANKLYEETDIQAIAIAIRAKKGTSNTYTVAQMAGAVESIETAADPTLQNKTVTPSTSSQAVTADAGYDGLGTVTVGAIQTETKSVTPSTSAQTITPTSGKYLSQVGVAAMPSGALATPTVNSSGLVTAAVGTSGYLASGTRKTLQLTTQAAQTITPGTSAQTISAGRYLTGTQTISGDANLAAENIANGVSIFGVTGTHSGGGASFQQSAFNLGGGTSYDGMSIAYGSGGFIAANDDTVRTYLSSTDGKTWARSRTWGATSYSKKHIFYGGGNYIVLDSDGGILKSDTGLSNSWTRSVPSVLGGAVFNAGTYGAGKYVIAASDSQNGGYSLDATNWTLTTMPSSSKWSNIVYGDGSFIATVSDSNIVAYSTDGITWTSGTLPLERVYAGSAKYGNGNFVALCNSGGAYSPDGVNWTQFSMPAGPTTWTGLTFGGGIFVAFGYNTSVAAYSVSGAEWTIATLPVTLKTVRCCYGNNIFTALEFQTDKKGVYCDITPTIA